jgi:hypothetical protein
MFVAGTTTVRFPSLEKMKSQLSDLAEGREGTPTSARAVKARLTELGFVWPDKVLELVRGVYPEVTGTGRYNWPAAIRATRLCDSSASSLDCLQPPRQVVRRSLTGSPHCFRVLTNGWPQGVRKCVHA